MRKKQDRDRYKERIRRRGPRLEALQKRQLFAADLAVGPSELPEIAAFETVVVEIGESVNRSETSTSEHGNASDRCRDGEVTMRTSPLGLTAESSGEGEADNGGPSGP